MSDLTNIDDFEKEWVALAEEVISRIFQNPTIQEIKTKLRTKGKLGPKDRNAFITIIDKVKYDLVFSKYGPADSEGFKAFTRLWEQWLKHRGVVRNKAENMFEENINHLLFGSTPDPERFLREFNLYADDVSDE